MRYFVLIFIFGLASFCGFAQNNNSLESDKSILWEISKEGISQKSYLLGTYHGGTITDIGYIYIDSLPQFRKILEHIDAIGIECDLTDSTFVKMMADNINNCIFRKYPQYAFLPDSVRDISQLFTDMSEYDFICSFMQELKRMKFPIAYDYESVKPFFTMQMFSQFARILRVLVNRKNGVVVVCMDEGIQKAAMRLGKRQFFMESAEYHAYILNKVQYILANSLTLKEQAQSLYLFCKEFKAGRNTINLYEKEQQELYLKGDLKGMIDLEAKNIDVFRQSLDFSNLYMELLIERNKDWLPKIISNIENESCLIAVGAMHLSGEKGLINLLRKKGYMLKPIDIYERSSKCITDIL